ncbi:hypothetical protein Tco_0355532 [Tanacetum coccineum]
MTAILIAQDEPTEFALMAYTSGQLSTKDKTGLGYGDQLSKSDSEVPTSVFDSRSSDRDDNQTNDRFKKGDGYHAVPPPLTRNYMPPLADLSFAGLDDSVYKPTANKTSVSTSQGDAGVTQTSNISVEMPKVDSVRTNRVIIEDWVSNDEEYKFQISKGKVNIVRVNSVNTTGQIAVSTVEGYRVTAVKASASCVWRPKMTDLNNVSKDNSGSWISKRENPQQAFKVQRMFDSRWPRQYEQEQSLTILTIKLFDGGFDAFSGRLLENDQTCVGLSEGKATQKPLVKAKLVSSNYQPTFNRFRIWNLFDPTSDKEEPNWLFYIDSLTNSMNYQPVTTGNQTNKNAGPQETNGDTGLKKNVDAGHTEEENVSAQQYIMFPLWSSISLSYKSSNDKAGDDTADDVAVHQTFSPLHDPLMPKLEDTTKIQSIGIFGNAYDDDDLETHNYPNADETVGAEADFNNMEPFTVVSPIPTTRIHTIHPKA